MLTAGVGACGTAGMTLARQLPLGPSRCVLVGHTHWPPGSLVPPMQGPDVVGDCVGADVPFGTQRPPRISCQGKQSLSVCAWAGAESRKSEQNEIAAAAKKRVIVKPFAIPKSGRQNSLNERAFTIEAEAGNRYQFVGKSRLFWSDFAG